MAMGKPMLLRDRLPRQRRCWADLADSSNEQLPTESAPPPPPVIDSQESYSKLMSLESVEDVGGSRPSLHRQLQQAASLSEAPEHHSWAGAGWPPGLAEARAPTLPAFEACAAAEAPPEAPPLPAEIFRAASGCQPREPREPPRAAVRRRISSKRPADPRTPLAGKRPRGGGAAEGEEAAARGQRPLAEASEEDWQRRAEKRQAAVAAIRDSEEYRVLWERRSQGDPRAANVPGTPDPNNRETSKRSWEAKVMQWRNALKEWYAEGGHEL